jgi:hypothetical protein
MNLQPTDVAGIAGAIAVHGPAPNARLNLQLETQAAEESLQTGLYISWVPHPSCILGPSAADETKNGTGQCCRVGSHSFCRCGHQLSSHRPLGKIKAGYNKPPACSTCKRCPGFEYSPHFPEECGQWWLSRRKDFVLSDWRKVSPDSTCPKLGILLVSTIFLLINGCDILMPSDSDRCNCCPCSHSVQRVRDTPEEYCCIGCEQKVSDHETLFESRATRMSRGAAVDEAYIPLADLPQQIAGSQQVLRVGATNHTVDMDTIRKVCSETGQSRLVPRVRALPAAPITSHPSIAVQKRGVPLVGQTGRPSDAPVRTSVHRK